MTIISGNVAESGRIMILREPDWSIEHMQEVPAGDFRISYLSNGNKAVIFRRSDGLMVAYGSIEPYQPTIEGSMYSWGRDIAGELGLNNPETPINISVPSIVGDESVWVKIKSGQYFSMAIRSDGTLWSCGTNNYGQLGLGLNGTQLIGVSTFTQVGTDNDWVGLACGWLHTTALKGDGTIWSCGRGVDFQLGGNYAYKSTLTRIGTDTDWAKISCNEQTSHAIKTNGTRWAWGANSLGQFGNGGTTRSLPTQIGSDTTWQKLGCGRYHVMSIKNNGSLWSWGGNQYGPLGLNHVTSTSIPMQVGTSTDWINSFSTTYNNTSFVLNTSGELWACGQNSDLIGHGDKILKSTLTKIGTDSDWSYVSAGASSSIFLKNDGRLFVCGNNSYGQLGQELASGTSTPVQLGTASDWSVVNAGYYSVFAIK